MFKKSLLKILIDFDFFYFHRVKVPYIFYIVFNSAIDSFSIFFVITVSVLCNCFELCLNFCFWGLIVFSFKVISNSTPPLSVPIFNSPLKIWGGCNERVVLVDI